MKPSDYGLTSEQGQYAFNNIVSILAYYGIDNPSEREKCAHEILDEIDYAIENK